jgi:hypothetical protein
LLVRDVLVLAEVALEFAVRAMLIGIDGAQVASMGAQDRAQRIASDVGNMELAYLAFALDQRKDRVLVVSPN